MVTLSSLLALFEGNTSVIGRFPSKRSGTRAFDTFFVVSLHILQNIPSSYQRYEMQWRSCDVTVIFDDLVITYNYKMFVIGSCYIMDMTLVYGVLASVTKYIDKTCWSLSKLYKSLGLVVCVLSQIFWIMSKHKLEEFISIAKCKTALTLVLQ